MGFDEVHHHNTEKLVTANRPIQSEDDNINISTTVNTQAILPPLS